MVFKITDAWVNPHYFTYHHHNLNSAAARTFLSCTSFYTLDQAIDSKCYVAVLLEAICNLMKKVFSL